MLKNFGIEISETASDRYFIQGGQRYHSDKVSIRGDWSSASNWLVAGALDHDLSLVGASMDSLQADKAIVGLLESCGCDMIYTHAIIRISPP